MIYLLFFATYKNPAIWRWLLPVRQLIEIENLFTIFSLPHIFILKSMP